MIGENLSDVQLYKETKDLHESKSQSHPFRRPQAAEYIHHNSMPSAKLFSN
jgi:hypothetical protein